MPFIDVEPTWEACARIYTLLVERGEDAKAKEEGRQGLLGMGRKLDEVRQAQKAQEKVAPTPGINFIDYEAGDYLLLDSENQIQGVSGNSEFWDNDENGPLGGSFVNEYGDEYTIVMVVRVHQAR